MGANVNQTKRVHWRTGNHRLLITMAGAAEQARPVPNRISAQLSLDSIGRAADLAVESAAEPVPATQHRADCRGEKMVAQDRANCRIPPTGQLGH